MTAVAEKQANIDFVLVSLAKHEQKNPEHIARHPFGKVPVITDGNVHIYESRAICRYVNDRFKTGNPLIPNTLEGKALFDQWASLEQGTFNPKIAAIIFERAWKPLLFKQQGNDQVAREAYDAIQPAFEVLEKQLASHGKQYLLGDQYTLVDIFFTPYFNWLMQTPEKSLIENRPHVAKYWKALSERPSWKQVTAKAG